MPRAVPGMALLEAVEDRAVLCVPWDSPCFMEQLNSHRLLLNVPFALLDYEAVPSDKPPEGRGTTLCPTWAESCQQKEQIALTSISLEAQGEGGNQHF